MSSKREVELKKAFPEATEKLLKDYKCALYLDFHHPGIFFTRFPSFLQGRLFITETHLYFYSTKNIQPPLPSPLAVTSAFKDLKSIEKSGIDSILIAKGDEEILLDSFQYRNETFDTLQRCFLKAGGKGTTIKEQKREYKPLDIEIRELMTRSIDGLPFFNDLGLLSLHYNFSQDGKNLFKGSETQSLQSSTERLKLLLFTLSDTLEKGFESKKKSLESAFDIFFEKANDPKVKHSVSPPTVIEFLRKHYLEDSPVIVCLKACIHPITAAIIRLKDSLTSFYPTKDKSWEVSVEIQESTVKVVHLRHEQSTKGLFEVQWKMSLVFDRNLKDLKEVLLNVTDLIFHEDTKEATRYELQQLLKDYLPHAKLGGKTSVLLPSFVDLSNLQLTEIPAEIFDMVHLQTLYLHLNQIDKIPDSILRLKNLQVLYLNQNKLSEFPSVVCSMPSIRELHLGRNKIVNIPPEIGKMTGLRELSLSYNLLNGSLPQELLQLKNLRKLYLHNNYLEDIPAELAELPNLKTIQIHNNQKMTGPLAEFGPEDSEGILLFLKGRKP